MRWFFSLLEFFGFVAHAVMFGFLSIQIASIFFGEPIGIEEVWILFLGGSSFSGGFVYVYKRIDDRHEVEVTVRELREDRSD